MDPERNWGGRGTCSPLCDPRGGGCGAGDVCVNFGNVDDPETPDFNETRHLGICLTSECTVLGGGCQGGELCRPYNFVAAEGTCSAPGAAGLGDRCEQHEDCGDLAFCANAGNGPVCLAICDPGNAQACGVGERCFTGAPGWEFGVCL